MPRHLGLKCLLFLAITAVVPCAATADNFADVHYDASDDSLVVTMQYRGTNPNHVFSLKWGRCKDLPQGGGRQIIGNVIDSQWRDAALHDFTATTRFSLTDLNCRPAKITLRTAPRFYYSLQVP